MLHRSIRRQHLRGNTREGERARGRDEMGNPADLHTMRDVGRIVGVPWMQV